MCWCTMHEPQWYSVNHAHTQSFQLRREHACFTSISCCAIAWVWCTFHSWGDFVLHSDCTSLLVTLLHATDAKSALFVLAPNTTSLCNMRRPIILQPKDRCSNVMRGNAYYHANLPCIRMCWPSFDPLLLVIPDFIELQCSH